MLLTGRAPIDADDDENYDEAVQRLITAKARDEPKLHAELGGVLRGNPRLSADSCAFVLSLMTVDPTKRLSAPAALQHPWLSNKFDASAHTAPASLLEGHAGDAVQDTMLGNLKRFKHRNALERTAMLALAVGTSADELKKLNAAFADIDTNNDGLISFAEFSAMLCRRGVYDAAEIKGQFDAVDQDHSGFIQYAHARAAH